MWLTPEWGGGGKIYTARTRIFLALLSDAVAAAAAGSILL
jgi:hypothetical protein